MSETLAEESSYPSQQSSPVTELLLEPGYAYHAVWFILILASIGIGLPLVLAGAFGLVQAMFSAVAIVAAVFILHLRGPRMFRVGDEGITFGKRHGRKRTIRWDSIKEIRCGKKWETKWVYVPGVGYDVRIVGIGWRDRIYVEFSLYTVRGVSVKQFMGELSRMARKRGIRVIELRYWLERVQRRVDELSHHQSESRPISVKSKGDGMDPRTAVGKRVQLEIGLDWDLEFPDGTIVRTMGIRAETSHVFYLVELDSPLAFEPHERKRFWGRKRFPEEVVTRHVIVEIRRVEALKEELKGNVYSQYSRPILYAPKGKEVLDQPIEKIELDELYAIGPGTIRIIG